MSGTSTASSRRAGSAAEARRWRDFTAFSARLTAARYKYAFGFFLRPGGNPRRSNCRKRVCTTSSASCVLPVPPIPPFRPALSSAKLVGRRPLHAIDDDEFAWRPGRFELQPELIFDRGKDRLATRNIRRVAVLWRRRKHQRPHVLVDGEL